MPICIVVNNSDEIVLRTCIRMAGNRKDMNSNTNSNSSSFPLLSSNSIISNAFKRPLSDSHSNPYKSYRFQYQCQYEFQYRV